MQLNIALVNIDTREPAIPLVYVNRGADRYAPSVLANIFYNRRTEKDWRNFAFYRVWLWDKMKQRDPQIYPELLRLLAIAENGLLLLGCHCATQIQCEQKPVKEINCHAEVIANALRWLAINTKSTQEASMGGHVLPNVEMASPANIAQ